MLLLAFLTLQPPYFSDQSIELFPTVGVSFVARGGAYISLEDYIVYKDCVPTDRE